MFLRPYVHSFRARSKRIRGTQPTPRQLRVEPLENRCVLAAGLSASLVADMVPGADSSNPYDLTNLGGTLYLRTDDPVNGMRLWKSDGTASGTTFVKTLNTPRLDVNLRAMNGSVYFVSNVSAGIAEEALWKTDGTPGGTSLIKQLPANNLTPIKGKLFFTSFDSTVGAELWVSDGTAPGTVLLKDIDSGTTKVCEPAEHGGGKVCSEIANNSNPSELTNLNGTLLFAASDGKGRELWKSDGTAAGTTLVKNIASGSASSNPQNLTVVGNVVYFTAAGGLWRSDGTSAGTVLVKNMAAANLTNVNGTLYFMGTDTAHGAELWKSDGTPRGTVLIKDIVAGSSSASPLNLTNVNGTLFFSAADGTNGRELWKSNGTAAGTILVSDINLGSASSAPTQLTNVNGRLYFSASDGVNGNELWQSDGTEAGTVMVHDIYPGSTDSNPAYLTSMNNKLYFASTDPVHGRELWDPPPVADSGSYLLVPDFDRHNILRFDAFTGAFVDEFVPRKSGGLTQPYIALLGPDGSLYVSTGHFQGPGQIKAVLRYDGTTGEFIDEFVQQRQMDQAHQVLFGPDGNLYVGDRVDGTIGHPQGGRILRFSGQTGAFMDEFVPRLSGGLKHPDAYVFGPDKNGDGKLDLYVCDEGPSRVLSYDGTTGAFLGEFVAGGSGGLAFPQQLSFGPDGNLYVASIGTRSVMRFQGPSGESPGAPIPADGNSGANFVAPGSGGLLDVIGTIFGPDCNGDGHQDLYVSDINLNNSGFVRSKPGSVKRYDGVTGAFLDNFVAPGSGGLDSPSFLTFTETDPVTLAYRGGDKLTAESLTAIATDERLAANRVQPLVTEALTRWQASGVDTSCFGSIQIQITNLGGTRLGLAAGNTIWLDDNAAGWGWFVDATPGDDSEFVLRGNRGEQNRIDLLTVVMHELGHLLGYDHDDGGVMADTLGVGVRRTGLDLDDAALIDHAMGQASDHWQDALLGAWLNEQFDAGRQAACRRQ